MTRFCLALAFCAIVAGCGGSSSETPFPLEPDLGRLGDGGPPSSARYIVFTGAKRDGGAEAGKSTDPDEEELGPDDK